MLQRFERMRLVNHLGNGADALEIGAVRSDSVNANISNEEHAPFALGLRFRSQQPGQHVNILASGLYDCHGLTSLAFCSHPIGGEADI
jgi:hypothetical protein